MDCEGALDEIGDETGDEADNSIASSVGLTPNLRLTFLMNFLEGARCPFKIFVKKDWSTSRNRENARIEYELFF